MNKKLFWLGIVLGTVLGIVLTFVVLLVLSSMIETEEPIDNTPIVQYYEQPMSYENKEKSYFRVHEVLCDTAAYVKEGSADEMKNDSEFFSGKSVILLGKNFYNDQIITVKNPQRVGTFKYPLGSVLPIIDGEME